MATLMDVFGAATQAASPFLRQGTEQLKERNDLELRNYAARFATDLQDFTRDNPYNGDFDEYMGKLNAFTEENYGRAYEGNTSAYSRKMLEQMRTQSMEMVRGHALVEQDKWRVQAADVRYQSDKEAFLQLPPELAPQAVTDALDLLKLERYVGPEEEHREMEDMWKTLYTNKLSERLAGVNDVDQLDDAIKEVKERFQKIPGWETPVSAVDAEGKLTGETGKRERGFAGEADKKLRGREEERIYRQHMDAAEQADAAYRRLCAEGRTDEADTLARSWREGVIAEIMSGDPANYREAKNYAPDQLDHVAGLFMPRGGRGEPRLGGLSPQQLERYMKVHADELTLAYLNGQLDYESGAALREKMPELLYEEMSKFYGYKGPFERFMLEHMPFWASMYDSMKKAAENPETKAMIPVLRKEIEKAIELGIKGSSNDPRYKGLKNLLEKEYKGQSAIIVQELINDCSDLFLSTDWKNTEPDEALEAAHNIIGAFTGRKLAQIRAAAERNPFTGKTVTEREKALAGLAGAIEALPQMVTTLPGQGAKIWRGPDKDPGMHERGLGVAYTEGKQFVAQSLAGELGESAGDVMGKLRQINKIDVKRDEQDPALLYQYGDSGVFYRVKQSPADEKKIIIEKQSTEGKSAAELSDDKWESQAVNREWGQPSEIDTARRTEQARQAAMSNVEFYREKLYHNPNDTLVRALLERAEQQKAELIEAIQQERNDRAWNVMIESAVTENILTEGEAWEMFRWRRER